MQRKSHRIVNFPPRTPQSPRFYKSKLAQSNAPGLETSYAQTDRLPGLAHLEMESSHLGESDIKLTESRLAKLPLNNNDSQIYHRFFKRPKPTPERPGPAAKSPLGIPVSKSVNKETEFAHHAPHPQAHKSIYSNLPKKPGQVRTCSRDETWHIGGARPPQHSFAPLKSGNSSMAREGPALVISRIFNTSGLSTNMRYRRPEAVATPVKKSLNLTAAPTGSRDSGVKKNTLSLNGSKIMEKDSKTLSCTSSAGRGGTVRTREGSRSIDRHLSESKMKESCSDGSTLVFSKHVNESRIVAAQVPPFKPSSPSHKAKPAASNDERPTAKNGYARFTHTNATKPEATATFMPLSVPPQVSAPTPAKLCPASPSPLYPEKTDGLVDHKVELLSCSSNDGPEKAEKKVSPESRHGGAEPRQSSEFRIWNQLVFTRRSQRISDGTTDYIDSLPGTPELRSQRRDLMSFGFTEDDKRQSMSKSDKKIWFRNNITELSGLHDEIVKVDGPADQVSGPAGEAALGELQAILDNFADFKGRLFSKNKILGPIIASERLLPKFPLPKAFRVNDGPVRGFAASSHCGIKRVTNEDRVAVSLCPGFVCRSSLANLSSKGRATGLSVFSVFDGHGGATVAEFLKDRLSNTLAQSIETEGLSAKTIKSTFEALDRELMDLTTIEKEFHSGSCAVSLVVLEESLIIMNVGDSRCVASQSKGNVLRALTNDHKPELIGEFSRIIENGGRIERESVSIASKLSEFHFATKFSHVRAINKLKKGSPDKTFNPWRILPGGLTVSRSLGDSSSKLAEIGGRPGVVSCEPDVLDFETDEFDFLVLACKLTSRRSV